jgi:ligand-binding SRPBCC domain-containing protein
MPQDRGSEPFLQPPTHSLADSRPWPRGTHLLQSSLLVRRPIEDVFEFFGAAENLQRITPPELGFQILTPLPVAMGEGTLIDYRIRLFGAPMKWKTLISHWDPPNAFVDEQLSGPYALWVHSHRFESRPEGTLVTDEVRYRLPLYPLGELALPLVRFQLNRIFRYRTRRLLQELTGTAT